MSFGGLNPLAIVLAALAAFGWGLIYHGVLARLRPRAAGVDRGAAPSLWPMLVTTFAAELVMAWVLAGSIGHLGVGQVTLRNGLVSALFVWAGFLATTTVVNHRREGLGWSLTLIDAGHWLGAALVMGAVIGGIGV